jgi:2-methylisocitrate lyase-like PEP mutase family enzyme
MHRSEQRRRAERLRSYHHGPPILVLPNAWDVASARVFAAIDGCRAIATASAAIAPSLGYSDHEGTPRDVMLAAVERIAHAVDLPVTADLEAGYGDPEATAEGAIAAGAVGLNFEDGTNRPDKPLVQTAIQAERVAAMRAVADRLGVPLGTIKSRMFGGLGRPRELLARRQRSHRRLPRSGRRARRTTRRGDRARPGLPRGGR